MATGVAAVKIEGRQRSPAYVGQVTRIWRQPIDACHARPERFRVRDAGKEVVLSTRLPLALSARCFTARSPSCPRRASPMR